MANKNVKFETLKAFCFLFRTVLWKDFHQNVHIESRLLKGRKIYCLQACLCIFHPGNLTGFGSEGVKKKKKKK